MKRVAETYVPRAVVREGGLYGREFTAQLDKVVQRDAAYETYETCEM